MEMWACSSLGEYVNFICVCVDNDKSVALSFEKMFKFTKAINGVIMNREDMPTFGQLGCSGFIVIGSDGGCVSKKTSSFLDFGEKAFRNTEHIIKTALEDAGIDLNGIKEEKHLYANGQTLRLEGILSNPALNGNIVTVMNFDTSKGRFNVMLSDGSNRQISVLPCCLAPITPHVVVEQQLKEIQPPNRVGCIAVDEEHLECTTAINECFKSCTRENLSSMLVCLEQHFQHEETLASVNGFGSVTDSLSPLFSHAKDHTRILNLIRTELKKPSGIFDVNVVQIIASAFLSHANVFDSLFEGKLLNQ